MNIGAIQERIRRIKVPSLVSGALTKGRDLYGVDIGSHSLKVVQLSGKPGAWRLERWGFFPFPGGGEINPLEKTEEASRLLREFVGREKKGPRAAAVSVAGNSVVVRYVKLPKMPSAQLAKNLALEAEPYIPFSLPEVNLAFQVLGDSVEEGQPKMETVLVAAKKDLINNHLEILKSARLEPALVDIDAFCLQHVAAARVSHEETVLVVNLGAAVTTMSILEKGLCRVARDVFIAGGTVNKAFQKQLGHSRDEAESAKLETAVAAEPEPSGEAAPAGAAETPSPARVLLGVVKDLVHEIQRSLDFYLSQNPDRQIQRALLAGGTSKLKGLAPYLASELRLPVETFDPLEGIAGGESVPSEARPHLAVAVGLAMRRDGNGA